MWQNRRLPTWKKQVVSVAPIVDTVVGDGEDHWAIEKRGPAHA